MLEETFKRRNKYILVIGPTKRIGEAFYIGKNEKGFVFLNKVNGKLRVYQFESFTPFQGEIWIERPKCRSIRSLEVSLSESEEKFLEQCFYD